MKKTNLFGFGMMALLGLALIGLGLLNAQPAPTVAKLTSPVAPAVVAGDTVAAVDLNTRDAMISSDEIADVVDTSNQTFSDELAATHRDDMMVDDSLAMAAPEPPAAPAPSAEVAPASWGRHHNAPHFVWHRIRWGETLSRIAHRFDTTVSRLVRLNGIRCPDHIVAGRWILVPA